MKRTRGAVKKYIESSESEDDRPLKKTPPLDNKPPEEDGSSSESDIENYLQKPEKLDLNSEFFNTKTTTEFENIEKNIFSGVTRLSDTDSDSDKEPEPGKSLLSSPKDSETKLQTQENNDMMPTTSMRLSFDQLEKYTKQIEEAKRHVEIYQAKKQGKENKLDISNLLAAGEKKMGLEQNISVDDLHSSDFESCDSEREDWEEVKLKPSEEKGKKDLIPAKGLQITVDMPGHVKKKKGIDLVAALKRRLNRIRKENQLLVHKVHLLCWLAHGNYVNSIINDSEVMAMALSLLPSEQSYPSDRPDLSYLEQITAWYKKTIRNIEKPVPANVPFHKCLQQQMSKKEAYNKKMLAVIFVAILRALGIQARIVMSLQVEPLKPPASELHSLSSKEGKMTNNDKGQKVVLKSIISKGGPSGRSKIKSEIEINIQGPSPEGSNKIINQNDVEHKEQGPNKAKSMEKRRSKKEETLDIETEHIIPQKRRRITGATDNLKTKKIKKTPDKTTKISDILGTSNSTTELDVPRKVSRTRSTSLDLESRNKKKPKVKSETNNEPCLIPNLKSNTRAKSTGNIPSEMKSKTSQGGKTKIESAKSVTNTRTGKRAKSTESTDSMESTASTRSTRNSLRQSGKTKIESAKSVTNTRTRKRAKSTESTDSIKSTAITRSTKNSLWQDGKIKIESAKSVTNTRTRKRAKSTESTDSIKSTASTRSTRNSLRKIVEENKSLSLENNVKLDNRRENPSPKKTKSKSKLKQIAQLDGIYDSDSDVERTILQVDGANDKNHKGTPNLKTLKKATDSTSNKQKNVAKPNLRSLANKNNRKNVPVKQSDYSDSDSEFEPSSGSPFKNRLEKAKPDLKKLKNIQRQSAKQADVKTDVMKLVKGRIAEQKKIDRSRMAKRGKREPISDDSDSDYAPEAVQKKHHDSEDDFVPKTKVKRRVQVRPVLSDSDSEKKKKKGNDVWVEVFLEAEEKWISVDVVYGQVHCIKEISQRATHPISYVVAWDNNNNLKDVSRRYCVNFNTVTRKLRIDEKWWRDSLKPFMGLPTARDKEEDDDLARQQLDQPLPKSITEYKNHPLYALKRHLLKFEALYPPDAPSLGFVRGEAVYPRGCVFTLHSRDIWLKQAKVVKLGEEPYKIVKARPKWDKLSNKLINDQLLEIFGPWQVQDYEPPTAENGIVPKNAFGNVDLFKPCMIPKGCVHLKLPGLNKVARRMNIDCASAIVGFDFHGGWSHPVYDGFIVCQEFEDRLVTAWELEQDEIERKEQEKIDKRVYGNWKKLIRGLLIRERLKAKYDFGASCSDTKEKKKAKAPTFCTKKK